MQLYEAPAPTLEDHIQARLEILEHCAAFAKVATSTITGCRVKDFCDAYALVPRVERSTIYRWRRNPQPIAKSPDSKRPPHPTPEQRSQAKKVIVEKAEEFLAQHPDKQAQPLLFQFSCLYNNRQVDLPSEVYHAVKKCSRSSIYRWRAGCTEKGREALAPRSTLLANPESKATIEALISQHPTMSDAWVAELARHELSSCSPEYNLSLSTYKRAVKALRRNNSQ